MKAYSQDLRERILRAVDLDRPRAEIVQIFGISLATIKRYLKQRREEGQVRPKAIPGRPPKKRAQVKADVLPQLQVHDEARLPHHCDLWEQARARTCEPVDQESSDQAAGLDQIRNSRSGQRSATRKNGRAFRANASKLPTEALVVIDETGSTIALTPLYARAPKGERAAGQIVVMDNLRAHKSARVRTAIEAKGCQLLFATSPLTRPFSH